MIRKYEKPEIKISFFDSESVNATNVLSQPVYGNNLNTYIQDKQKVQKNFDFNKAIEFK